MKVYRQDVIAAEMIKKEVVLNPDIELDFSEERTLNQNLIKAALGKRNQLAEAYKELDININPLLLIQLPNDTKETMTADDTAIAEQVKTYLRVACDITEENGLLAVWLANEKSNLPNLERPDNLAQVLLFKEAIALGWDCPRAAVLLIFLPSLSVRKTSTGESMPVFFMKSDSLYSFPGLRSMPKYPRLTIIASGQSFISGVTCTDIDHRFFSFMPYSCVLLM